MDIALSDMMGYDFAVEFAEYAEKVKDIPVKSIAKVKGNPGQSKHLETAKTVFMGIELDFVNLRDEEYADESRIPTKVVSLHYRPLPIQLTYMYNLDVRHPTARCSAKRYHDQYSVL